MLVPKGTPVAAAPPILVALGPGSRSEVHAHHAWHLIVAQGGELALRTSPRSRVEKGGAVLVAPDAPHGVDATGARVAIVFVDAESDLGASLAAVHEGAHIVEAGAVARIREELLRVADGPGLLEAAPRVLSALGAAPELRRKMHPAVRRTIGLLAAAPPRGEITLETLAARVRLSPSRLQHAFRESVGLPLRPYVLWARVLRAGGAIARGASMTAAAYEAGFADAAHMTRTFRRMFGVTPSELRGERS